MKARGATIIGLAYLVLVVVLVWFCAYRTSSFDDFAKYWGLFATLVGVATGAIPSFFFGSQASAAKSDAAKARTETAAAHKKAERETARSVALAGLVDKADFQGLAASHPHLFDPPG